MAIDFKSSPLRARFNTAAGSKFVHSAAQVYKDEFFTDVENNDLKKVMDAIARHPEAGTWKNDDGMTALMIAALNGFSEIASGLIFHSKAVVDEENENGSTALMYAAYAGKATIADTLLRAGADVIKANNKGHTPLMSAAAYGHKNTIAVLLAAGADPRHKSEDGFTATDFAKDNDHTEIATLLGKLAGDLDAHEKKATSLKEAPEDATAEEPPAPAEEVRAETYKKAGSAIHDLQSRMGKAGLFG